MGASCTDQVGCGERGGGGGAQDQELREEAHAAERRARGERQPHALLPRVTEQRGQLAWLIVRVRVRVRVRG